MKRWIGQRRFLHALNYCMLLPGPEAQQLATYTGWPLNGVRGGLIAGALFVLPGLLVMIGLSTLYVAFGDTSLASGLFFGLAPAVVVIISQALITLIRRSLNQPSLILLAVAAFGALTAFAVPFPAVALGAGLLGWIFGRIQPSWMAYPEPTSAGNAQPPLVTDDQLHNDRPTSRRMLIMLLVALTFWSGPIVAVALLIGPDSILVDQGLFFSGAALISFGGAYAAIAHLAQEAVSAFGWLQPADMVRGLALAETTPGPLILVVCFVAFVGAYRSPGSLDPWIVATLGALMTAWVTFVPCFMFVLLGAPSVEKIRSNRSLTAALTGITAAVVGVIANLAFYFALHTFFTVSTKLTSDLVQVGIPVPNSVSWFALMISGITGVLLFILRWSVLAVLGVCALLGVVVQVAAPAL